MITRRRHNKNSNENLVFSSGTHKSRAWTEFARASVQISNKTLVSGEFGTTKIVKGNLTFSLGNIQRECSVKMLKGKVLVFNYTAILNTCSKAQRKTTLVCPQLVCLQ